MEKYYEEIFKVPNEKRDFRFKNVNPIDILAMAEQFQMYLMAKDSAYYKSFLHDVLINTEVNVGEGKWLTVLDGNNYFPESLKSNVSGVKFITDSFFAKVIAPVFQKSSE